MSGVTPRVQVRSMPASPPPPPPLLPPPLLQAPGPGRARSETLTEQPRPDGGPGAAARAALQPLPLPDQHLPAPRAPKVMEARWSGLRAAADLGRLGRAAAAGPLAAEVGGDAQLGRRGARPPPLRARPAPKARPRRRLALQSRGPLATSRFHSQKKEREKKIKKERKGGRTGGKNLTQAGGRDRLRPPRSSVGGKGSGGGEGAGKEEDWATGGPGPGPAPRRRSLPPAGPPFPEPGGTKLGGSRLTTAGGSPPLPGKAQDLAGLTQVFPLSSRRLNKTSETHLSPGRDAS